MRLKHLLLLLICLSCKKLFLHTKQVPVEQTHTLFDRLIANAPDQQVPYPFSALLNYLQQYAEPVGVLLPLGRSLQRKAGYPDPFKDPRRLVALKGLVGVQASDAPPVVVEVDIARRLFLGYVEGANQIEVMSLLPGQSEFDFQLVEDYRAGAKPIVKTADRTFCRGCHQHGGPIFSPVPWDETNANRGIAALLKRYHPDGHVDGIPVEHEEDAFSGNNPAYIFDALVRDASEDMQANRLWHKADCREEKDPARCRGLVTRQALSRVTLTLEDGGFPPSSPGNEVSLSEFGFIGNPDPLDIFPFHVEAKRRLQKLQGYKFTKDVTSIVNKLNKSKKIWGDNGIQPEVEGRAILLRFFLIAATHIQGKEIKREYNKLPVSTKLTAEELNTVYQEVERILVYIHKYEMHKGGRLDPLVKRTSVVGHIVGSPALEDVLRSTLHILKAYSYQQIDTAISKLAQDTSSPLYNDRLDAVAVVKAILANLGYELKTKQWLTDLPASDTKPIPTEEVYLPSDEFGLSLLEYCSPCHGKDTEYNFLYFKTKKEFCQTILSERHKMAKALADGHMPPDDLVDEERAKLIKALTEGKFSFCQ